MGVWWFGWRKVVLIVAGSAGGGCGLFMWWTVRVTVPTYLEGWGVALLQPRNFVRIACESCYYDNNRDWTSGRERETFF